MLDWISRNKDWLFSGVLVAVPLAIIGWIWFSGGDPFPLQPDKPIRDNADRDKKVTIDYSLHQTHTGTGDNIGRDKIIHKHLLGSVDYQELVQEIKDAEELLAVIPSGKTNLRLKQSARVEELKQRLDDFKADVFRLHQLFTGIPVNTERLRKAKAHFDRGEFQEADAVLKAEEIQQDVERLQKKEAAAKDRLVVIERNVEEKTNEVLIKARPSLVIPRDEGKNRLKRTKEYFDQSATTSNIIFRISAEKFLQWQEPPGSGESMDWSKAHQYLDKSNQNWLMNHNDWRLPARVELMKLSDFVENFPVLYSDIDTFYWSSEGIVSQAWAVHLGNARMEWYNVDQQVGIRSKKSKFSVRLVRTVNPSIALLEYEEALKHYRSLVEQSPEIYLPNVASTLLSLSIFYLQAVPDTTKSVAYAQEAQNLLKPLIKQMPHLQDHLDHAEELLEFNKAPPEI